MKEQLRQQYLRGLVIQMMNCIDVEEYDLAMKYGEKFLKIFDNEEKFIIDDAEV